MSNEKVALNNTSGLGEDSRRVKAGMEDLKPSRMDSWISLVRIHQHLGCDECQKAYESLLEAARIGGFNVKVEQNENENIELGEYLAKVFSALGGDEKWDNVIIMPTGLMWLKKECRLAFLCNDTFYWATADLEVIEPEDVELLRKTVIDWGEVGSKWDWQLGVLFCCRKRKMRPMDQIMEGFTGAEKRLFEAAGPERPKNDEDAIWHGREGIHG